jgi:hypothetical protein
VCVCVCVCVCMCLFVLSRHAEQEKDLLKAFRARLSEVNAELKKESMRADRGAQEWMDKCAFQARELVRLKGIADAMTMENAAVRDFCRVQPLARLCGPLVLLFYLLMHAVLIDVSISLSAEQVQRPHGAST